MTDEPLLCCVADGRIAYVPFNFFDAASQIVIRRALGDHLYPMGTHPYEAVFTEDVKAAADLENVSECSTMHRLLHFCLEQNLDMILFDMR